MTFTSLSADDELQRKHANNLINQKQKPRINNDHKGTKIFKYSSKQTNKTVQNKVNKECEVKTFRLVSVGLECFQFSELKLRNDQQTN